MRFSVYYAPPPHSLLHQLGSAWLGRDAYSGESLRQPDIEDLQELTAEPCRYGFHATLKPPFTLRDGCNEPELFAAIAAFAALQTPFEITLMLQIVDGFLALVPAHISPKLDNLAAACVRDLDAFRQRSDDAELARRRTVPLSARQDEHLLRWGYPYVFQDFRFHMTLTRRLARDEAERVMPAALKHFADVIAQPFVIDGLSLFTEPSPGADFTASPCLTFPSTLHKATS
jgi:putative phosphonate metabolism protein